MITLQLTSDEFDSVYEALETTVEAYKELIAARVYETDDPDLARTQERILSMLNLKDRLEDLLKYESLM